MAPSRLSPKFGEPCQTGVRAASAATDRTERCRIPATGETVPVGVHALPVPLGTAKGEELRPALAIMKEWGKKHLPVRRTAVEG
jgi:hypothetical protein